MTPCRLSETRSFSASACGMRLSAANFSAAARTLLYDSRSGLRASLLLLLVGVVPELGDAIFHRLVRALEKRLSDRDARGALGRVLGQVDQIARLLGGRWALRQRLGKLRQRLAGARGAIVQNADHSDE